MLYSLLRLWLRDWHDVFSITDMCKRDWCKVLLVLTFLVSGSGLKEIFSLFFPRALNKHFVITMIFCIVSLLGLNLDDLRQKFIMSSPKGETFKPESLYRSEVSVVSPFCLTARIRECKTHKLSSTGRVKTFRYGYVLRRPLSKPTYSQCLLDAHCVGSLFVVLDMCLVYACEWFRTKKQPIMFNSTSVITRA